jgi:hypothetical protein
MSKKAKYKAVKDAMLPGFWFVESPRDIMCQRCTMSAARKIARALNAMEAKPKAKPFAFDWGGIDKKYKWAAMDDDFWWVYANKPHIATDETCWTIYEGDCNVVSRSRPPYPGDWRESLQKRPTK